MEREQGIFSGNGFHSEPFAELSLADYIKAEIPTLWDRMDQMNLTGGASMVHIKTALPFATSAFVEQTLGKNLPRVLAEEQILLLVVTYRFREMVHTPREGEVVSKTTKQEYKQIKVGRTRLPTKKT